MARLRSLNASFRRRKGYGGQVGVAAFSIAGAIGEDWLAEP